MNYIYLLSSVSRNVMVGGEVVKVNKYNYSHKEHRSYYPEEEEKLEKKMDRCSAKWENKEKPAYAVHEFEVGSEVFAFKGSNGLYVPSVYADESDSSKFVKVGVLKKSGRSWVVVNDEELTLAEKVEKGAVYEGFKALLKSGEYYNFYDENSEGYDFENPKPSHVLSVEFTDNARLEAHWNGFIGK